MLRNVDQGQLWICSWSCRTGGRDLSKGSSDAHGAHGSSAYQKCQNGARAKAFIPAAILGGWQRGFWGVGAWGWSYWHLHMYACIQTFSYNMPLSSVDSFLPSFLPSFLHWRSCLGA